MPFPLGLWVVDRACLGPGSKLGILQRVPLKRSKIFFVFAHFSS
jgi:hypothetical protein